MKKVAVINDLSGVGRCSLNVAITLLAHLECEPCVLPTAILSAQTGFPGYTFLDFTQYMTDYYTHWKEMGIKFQSIYTGFLGSREQMDIISQMIPKFREEGTLVVIDPVMGDNGALYGIYDTDYPQAMREFIRSADLITPNMTEFSLLTGYNFATEGICKEQLMKLGRELLGEGEKYVAITGVLLGDRPGEMLSIGLDLAQNQLIQVAIPYDGKSYSGTGDIMASILTGFMTQGYSLEDGITRATHFIAKAVAYTSQFEETTKAGIYYEKFLKELGLDETN